MLNFGNKEFRNLQEQVLKNAQDIEILKEKPSLKIVIVEELPETGEEGILYLVPKNPDPDTGDADSYDEYVWLSESESFELVGTTAIDLQNLPSPIYVTTENKPEGLSYGLRIQNNGWTSDLQQEGGAKLELTGTAVNVTGDLSTSGKVVIGATGYDIKKDGSNMVIEADGNAIKVRGNLIPNTGDTYGLGTTGAFWNYINVNSINFGNNATISKDSSNRVNLNNGGNTIIKVGGYGNTNRTYIANNLVPDTDGLSLNLGASNMRWSVGYINSIENDYGALQLRARAAANPWITLDTNNTGEVGGIAPASDQSAKLGNAGKKFLTTYTRYINDDSVNIAVSSIATKPDYDNPNVWASGKLANNTGSATIDYTDETGVGLPEWGLYMFTYGNAQCYVAFTESMWMGMLAGYPIRVACPCIEEAGGSFEGNTGNLKIEKTSTTGVIKVTVASTISGSATSTNGWDFQFIKVM